MEWSVHTDEMTWSVQVDAYVGCYSLGLILLYTKRCVPQMPSCFMRKFCFPRVSIHFVDVISLFLYHGNNANSAANVTLLASYTRISSAR
jgi:hypothetical protein